MNAFRKWFLITRAYAFPATLIPLVLSLVVAIRNGLRIDWGFLPFLFLSGLCFHAGTNLANDYFDFRNGVDAGGSDQSTWSLSRGLLSPRDAARWTAAFYLGAFLLGMPLLIRWGWPLTALAVTGFVGGYFYTAPPISYKYRGWGEVGVFLLMGPLLAEAGHISLTGIPSRDVLVFSLPCGFLVASIMYGNNVRDLESDRSGGLRTLAVRLGSPLAGWGYLGFVMGAYGYIVFLMIAGRISPLAAISFAILPSFLKNAHNLIKQRVARIQDVDVQTARSYLFFGFLYLPCLLL